jgi:hypothetical protein
MVAGAAASAGTLVPTVRVGMLSDACIGAANVALVLGDSAPLALGVIGAASDAALAHRGSRADTLPVDVPLCDSSGNATADPDPDPEPPIGLGLTATFAGGSAVVGRRAHWFGMFESVASVALALAHNAGSLAAVDTPP